MLVNIHWQKHPHMTGIHSQQALNWNRGTKDMPNLIRPLVCQAWYPVSGSGPFFTLQKKAKTKHLSGNASQILNSYLLPHLKVAGIGVAENKVYSVAGNDCTHLIFAALY